MKHLLALLLILAPSVALAQAPPPNLDCLDSDPTNCRTSARVVVNTPIAPPSGLYGYQANAQIRVGARGTAFWFSPPFIGLAYTPLLVVMDVDLWNQDGSFEGRAQCIGDLSWSYNQEVVFGGVRHDLFEIYAERLVCFAENGAQLGWEAWMAIWWHPDNWQTAWHDDGDPLLEWTGKTTICRDPPGACPAGRPDEVAFGVVTSGGDTVAYSYFINEATGNAALLKETPPFCVVRPCPVIWVDD